MKTDEIQACDRAEIEPFFPSKGWTERVIVPSDMMGSEILGVGSVPDTAELVVDYRTNGGLEKRIVLGFTERGMWIEKTRPLHPSPIGDDNSQSGV